MVDSLFEISIFLSRVLKHFGNVGVASYLPLGLPLEVYCLREGSEVCMHVFEMENVGSVGRDVLHVAVDVVLGSSSELERLDE